VDVLLGSCRVFIVHQLNKIIIIIIIISLITISISISQGLSLKPMKTGLRWCEDHRVKTTMMIMMTMFHSIYRCRQDHNTAWTLSRVERIPIHHVRHPYLRPEWMELHGGEVFIIIIIMIIIVILVSVMRWTAASFHSIDRR